MDKILIGCAMRGRYGSNNRISQHLEINSDKYANCITGVNKDSLILEIIIDDEENNDVHTKTQQ